MRHMLSFIVLVVGVASLAACSKTVHSTHWYMQHPAALKATNARCDKYHGLAFMNHRNCMNAADASQAIQQAAAKKWMEKWDKSGPYKVPDPSKLPPLR